MAGSLMAEAVNVELPMAIQAMIKRSCIIDFGVVQKVIAKGVVYVAVSVAESKKDVRYMTCTLVNFASKAFTLDIDPNPGDKVLVLFPRKYSSKMFDDNQKDVIIDKSARGYNMMCGLAILCNQYKTDTHNNLINLNNGTMSLQLAYSEDDKKNKVLMSINEDGELSYSSNENTAFTINKDGELSYSSNENVSLTINKDGETNLTCNNTTIKVDKSDVITVNNGKAEIKIDSSGNVTIDAKGGKLSIKNNSTDLKGVIDGLAQELENLTTVGSPATQATSPATKATVATWRTSKLNMLM